jgi:hypothetical protein
MSQAHWLRDSRHDALLALRHLRRGPGFALVAVATLALGTSATTAAFAVADAAMLRPLPFRDAEQLVIVRARAARRWRGRRDDLPRVPSAPRRRWSLHADS